MLLLSYSTFERKLTSRGLSGWAKSSREGLSSSIMPSERNMVRSLTSRAKRI